jgi:hypothetical protein
VSLALFPKSTLIHFYGLYISQSTQWYFRGEQPPTRACLQTWRRS